MGAEGMSGALGGAAAPQFSLFLRVSAPPREPTDFLFARRRGDAEKSFGAADAEGVVS